MNMGLAWQQGGLGNRTVAEGDAGLSARRIISHPLHPTFMGVVGSRIRDEGPAARRGDQRSQRPSPLAGS